MRDSEILQQAIELLGGRLLPDVHVRDATRVADIWVGLHRLYSKALAEEREEIPGGVIVGEATAGS